MRWLAALLGLTDPSGPAYLWWSGFGADLQIFAALAVFLRRHNCHEPGCWRLGRHPIDGTPYVVCRRHHPDIPTK